MAAGTTPGWPPDGDPFRRSAEDRRWATAGSVDPVQRSPCVGAGRWSAHHQRRQRTALPRGRISVRGAPGGTCRHAYGGTPEGPAAGPGAPRRCRCGSAGIPQRAVGEHRRGGGPSGVLSPEDEGTWPARSVVLKLPAEERTWVERVVGVDERTCAIGVDGYLRYRRPSRSPSATPTTPHPGPCTCPPDSRRGSPMRRLFSPG